MTNLTKTFVIFGSCTVLTVGVLYLGSFDLPRFYHALTKCTTCEKPSKNSSPIIDLPKIYHTICPQCGKPADRLEQGAIIGPPDSSESPAPTPLPSESPRKEENATVQAAQLWQKGFDVWVSTKDYAKATQYYEQSYKLDPNFPPTLSSYGYMLGAFYNRVDEGEAMLKKAMELDPTWAYAPYNLGLLYDITGRKELGIYWLQYTVDHFPNHPDIEWFRDHLNVAKENR